MMLDKHGTLSVTGTGKVQGTPDEAVVDLGVVTEGKTAAEAVASNARVTQAVIDAASAQPNHGVTTTGLSVSPILHFDQTTGVSTIVGFRATNGVEVRTEIADAGQVYDAGIAAGANASSGITFRIQDETPYREQALRLAVENAHQEAKVVAQSARVDLLSIQAIQVDPAGGRIAFRAAALDVSAVTTPVLPEQQTITATVQLVYRTRA
jgi:uncharacterized protein YggE